MLSVSDYFIKLKKSTIHYYIKYIVDYLYIEDIDNETIVESVYMLSSYYINFVVYYNKSYSIIKEYIKYVLTSSLWIILKFESDYNVPVKYLEEITSLKSSEIVKYELDILESVDFDILFVFMKILSIMLFCI